MADGRPLTAREREVLVWMVRHGRTFDEDAAVTSHDRERWLAQVDDVRVAGECECGTCPTINLCDSQGREPAYEGTRVLLQGGNGELGVLLFIDDDRLSCLEGYPLGEQAVLEFPEPARL